MEVDLGDALIFGASQSSGSLSATLGESHYSLGRDIGRMSYSVFDAGNPAKAVILLVPDLYGRSLFYQLLAKRMVADGFTVVLPEIFSGLHPVAEGDAERAMDRLVKLDQTKVLSGLEELFDEISSRYPDTKVLVMGFSVGGTLSMMLTTRRSLAGAIIFYGFPARRPPTENAPYIFVEHAQNIQCPIIGFWGDCEERVPRSSVDELAEVAPSLPYEVEVVAVPDVGHSFLCFEEADPRSVATSFAWERAMAFIRSNIATEV